MIAMTLFLLLNSTQDDWGFRCDSCGKDVPESETELIGHKSNEAHAHPQPCRYRIHIDCTRPVRCKECAKAKKLCKRCADDENWTPLEVSKTDFAQEKVKELVAFVGTKDDAPTRLAAHADKDEKAIQALPPLKVGGDLRCFLLWGGSPNSLDPKRRTVVAASLNEKENILRIHVTYAQYDDTSGFGGYTDYVYVGFQAVLGKLGRGDWKVRIFERTDTYRTPDDKKPTRGATKLGREFTFRITPT